jgi:hypothetical protein
MNPTKKALLLMVAVFVMLSLACNLGSIGGRGTPASNGGSSSSDAEQDQFSGGPSLPIIWKDKKDFSSGPFVASNLPIEVSLSGDTEAEVVFKGAQVEPNYAISANPPSKLNLFVVLQNNVPSVLYQDGDTIRTDAWVMDWQVEFLSFEGNPVNTVVYKRYATLYANHPQPFRLTIDQIPGYAFGVRVMISMINEPLTLSCITPDPNAFCATTADLGFKMPSPLVLLTPVELSLKIGSWNEPYPANGLLGIITFKAKNPFGKKMEFKTTLVFLDETGLMAGYWDGVTTLDPNATYNNNENGVFYQTSYFSAVPTRALVYTTTKFTDIIAGLR